MFKLISKIPFRFDGKPYQKGRTYDLPKDLGEIISKNKVVQGLCARGLVAVQRMKKPTEVIIKRTKGHASH